jgi:TPR repeat protein
MCYIITRDIGEPVRYGNESGFDAISGRQCHELTPGIAERLREYEKGSLPNRIDVTEPVFFDPRTGEPIVWYFKNRIGDIEIFDLMGFHPETGDELLPVSKDIVDLWKYERDGRKPATARTAPQRIDPEKYPIFDPVTGDPRAWYWRSESGDYEFYDNHGFQPHTGDPLQPISQNMLAKWRQEVAAAELRKKEYQLQREGEPNKREARQDREKVALVEAQDQDKQVADRCDQLAGNPNDPRRSGAGVSYDALKMHARDAVEICTAASAADPDEPRLKYQLGRALEFLDRKKAFDIQVSLVKLKYPAAYDNLGWMLFNDKKDITQAVNHFRMGAELGDPDSMVSLADMINRGAFNPQNSNYIRISLLKKAAALGDQAALRVHNSGLERQQDSQNHQTTGQARQRRTLETYGDVERSIPW